MERTKLLISACLLGAACRYDGKSVPLPAETLAALSERFELVPVCPEQLGGLPTPRESAEISGGTVVTGSGRDVTAQYARGAAQALYLAQTLGCRAALLKQRSPSCGSGEIYDGTFSRTLTPGDGVTAALLRSHGLAVFGESEIAGLLETKKNTGGAPLSPDGAVCAPAKGEA